MEVVPSLLETQVNTNSPRSAPDPQELGRDVFLRLLVTQLQGQDPTNPLQNEDFIAQLAQFTTLEQANDTNDLLEGLINQNQERSQLDQVGLIGHEVIAQGNTVSVDDTGETNLVYTLSDNTFSTEIEVFDSAGLLVTKLEGFGPQGVGRNQVVWDGTNLDGNHVEAGIYQFRVNAINSQQEPVSATTFMREQVKSVVWGNDQPILMLASGKSISSSDILSVE